MHSDHVSGLEILLKNIRVDLVILPYVSKVERIILWLNSYKPARWFFNFLLDPVSFLLNRGVRKIILLTRGDDGFREPSLYNEFNDLDIELYETLEEKMKGLFAEENRTTLDEWQEKIKGRKLVVAADKSKVKIKGLQKAAPYIWEFLFYVKKIEEEKLNKFKSCISGINLDDLKGILADEKRSKLKDCYEKVFCKKLNITSLLLYHGPLKRCRWSFLDTNFPIMGHFCLPPHSPDIINCPVCMGILFDDCEADKSVKSQLLCGDAELNKEYLEFAQHFGTKKLERVAICLLPHHGSEQNWNASLKKDLSNCTFWIASAALNNKYGHPSKIVQLNIEESSKTFYWVNEYNYIAFGLKFF